MNVNSINPDSLFVTISTDQHNSYKIELQPAKISDEKAITISDCGYKILGEKADVSWVNSFTKLSNNKFDDIEAFKNSLTQANNSVSKEKIENIVFEVLPKIKKQSVHPESSTFNKQELWDQETYKVNQITDALDLPIDAAIKEVIVALNVVGFRTNGSCEGHFDRGDHYPYIDIDIETPEIMELRDNHARLVEKSYKEQEMLEKLHPQTHLRDLIDLPEAQALRDIYSSIHLNSAKQKKAEQTELHPLSAFLDQFYADYHPPYDRILVIEKPIFRIRNVGADRQAMRSEEEIKDKLEEYQAEMQKFGQFLKKAFFAK